MKKRLLAVIAALFVAGASSAFATTGVGLQGGYTVGGGAGAALTFKLEDVPCVFALDAAFGENYLNVGLTADWWIQNPVISGTPFGFFYGVGIAGNVILNGSNYGGFGIGPRIVGGMNWFLINGFLELYVQAAYQPMFYFTDNFYPNWVSFPINGGFRVWF